MTTPNTPSLAAEAALAHSFPARHFNSRERKLLASVKDYVDASTGAGSVSLADLATGISPSHVIKAAGTKTLASTSTSQTITDASIASGDLVTVTGSTGAKLAVASAGSVAVTMASAPTIGDVLTYVAHRAAT